MREATCADCTVISTVLAPPAGRFEMEGFTLYFSGDVVFTWVGRRTMTARMSRSPWKMKLLVIRTFCQNLSGTLILKVKLASKKYIPDQRM